MKNLFNPEMFLKFCNSSAPGCQCVCANKADHCNAILSEYLEKEGVRVYMIHSDISVIQTISREKRPYDKYTTVIFPPEPIVKENPKCAKHDPTYVYPHDRIGDEMYRCRFCNIKLRQVFEEAE